MHLGLCLKLTCSEVGLALELTKVANPLNDQEHDFYRFKSCFHDYHQEMKGRMAALITLDSTERNFFKKSKLITMSF